MTHENKPSQTSYANTEKKITREFYDFTEGENSDNIIRNHNNLIFFLFSFDIISSK